MMNMRRGRGRGATNTPEQLWFEFLLTGTREYWLSVCQKAVAYYDREIAQCRKDGKPVSTSTLKRRKEYQDLIDYERLMP